MSLGHNDLTEGNFMFEYMEQVKILVLIQQWNTIVTTVKPV